MVKGRPIYIAIPAFGADYVKAANRYVIPSVLAALEYASMGHRAVFIIHTDFNWRFSAALKGYAAQYYPIMRKPPQPFETFTQCHQHAIALTPVGAILALLTADMVVSRETFAVADEILQDGKAAIASAGTRTVVNDEDPPPIGASADELADWIWENRHPITEANVWGRGPSRLPTMIYFEDGEDVALHCFHLGPMFIVKDRDLSIIGSIDDTMLAIYGPAEIVYLTERRASFAEISPREKTQALGNTAMSVQDVVDNVRHFKPIHLENFRHCYAIRGRPTCNHPAVWEILKKIAEPIVPDGVDD